MNHERESNTASAGARGKIGFVYDVEHIRNGKVLSVERVKNVIPEEGLDDILLVYFKSGTQKASWYIGLYEGNYTPTGSETAATIATLATETTAYDEAARPAWTSGSVADGSLSNTASKAEFTASATKTWYGGFLISNSTKNGALGLLASVVRFASPKSVEDDDILRVTAGITLLSAA